MSKRIDPLAEEVVVDWDRVEFDRIPGAWTVTWWLEPAPNDSIQNHIVLRLKILHSSSSWDPDHFIAEVKVGPDGEFVHVHSFMESTWAIMHEDEHDDEILDDLPAVWTAEFKALVIRWAKLVEVMEPAASVERTRTAAVPTENESRA